MTHLLMLGYLPQEPLTKSQLETNLIGDYIDESIAITEHA